MKIALEEHFICDNLLDYCLSAMPNFTESEKKEVISALSDLGEMRLDSCTKHLLGTRPL